MKNEDKIKELKYQVEILSRENEALKIAARKKNNRIKAVAIAYILTLCLTIILWLVFGGLHFWVAGLVGFLIGVGINSEDWTDSESGESSRPKGIEAILDNERGYKGLW